MDNPTPRHTSIDLTKRGDVAMVHRAIVNGWDVPDDVRKQICDQLGPAIELARTEANSGRCRRILKIAKLMLVMEASNMIDEGCPRNCVTPRLRKRYPERRQARRKPPADARAELEEMLKKLAELGSPMAGVIAGSRSAPAPAAPPPAAAAGQ